MNGYLINKNNFDLVPGDSHSPRVSGVLTLDAGDWSYNTQSVTVPMSVFEIHTINVPPADMAVWSENGVYASSEDAGLNSITFTCGSVPSQDLTFTVTTTPVSAIGDFEGTGNSLTQYNGTSAAVVVPDGVDDISASAFYDNTNVTSVLIPFGSMTIGEHAFENCAALTSFKGDAPEGAITDSVGYDSIGAYAFGGCTALTEIILDGGFNAAIADYAFSGCTGLTTIKLAGSYNATKLAFDGCINVTTIVFDYVPGVRAWTNNADFSFTDVLTAESLSDMITALYDYTGGEAHTLTVGATNRARISAEDIAAAEAKNWTVI